jgi:uncharacterized membrane protein YebE (DUF533 family)
MLGTLGKVAMGILVAKGVGKIIGGDTNSSGGLLGGLGGLLGGGGGEKTASNGGLGGLLSSLAGGHASQETEQDKNTNNKDFASLFNDALQGKEPESTKRHDQQAHILLNAIISAAKADGGIDTKEQEKILSQLKESSEEMMETVRQEVQAPLNLQALIDSVPNGMEQQVYLISLLAINLDTKAEVLYLDKLANGLNISNNVSNQIHDKLGVARLYKENNLENAA